METLGRAKMSTCTLIAYAKVCGFRSGALVFPYALLTSDDLALFRQTTAEGPNLAE